MPICKINSPTDLRELRSSVFSATHRAVDEIRELIASQGSIQVFTAMKFEDVGFHPLFANRRLNLIEQINQTFTYLVSLAAAEQVFDRHPGSAPIRLNLGTSAGCDLESLSASVAAEVFAAVRPTNNSKLVKDVRKISEPSVRQKYRYRYVFFYCPRGASEPYRIAEVEVIPLSKAQVLGFAS
jgi:hypothetical protein